VERPSCLTLKASALSQSVESWRVRRVGENDVVMLLRPRIIAERRPADTDADADSGSAIRRGVDDARK
jgi:hypothetical protein